MPDTVKNREVCCKCGKPLLPIFRIKCIHCRTIQNRIILPYAGGTLLSFVIGILFLNWAIKIFGTPMSELPVAMQGFLPMFIFLMGGICIFLGIIMVRRMIVSPFTLFASDLKLRRAPFVRSRAIKAIGEIGDSRAVEPLITMLSSPESDIVEDAAEALGKIGDKRAVEPLISVYTGRNNLRLNAAFRALKRLDNLKTIEALIPKLEVESMHALISDALKQLGDQKAVDLYISKLKDGNKDVRKSAARLLGEFADPRAAGPLIEILKEDCTPVRREAAQALGNLRDNQTVEPLIEALQDPLLIDAAAAALARLKDPQAVGPLIDVLRNNPGDAHWSVAFALGEIGDVRALEYLVSAAQKEKDPELRRQAQTAVKKIKDSKDGSDNAPKDEGVTVKDRPAAETGRGETDAFSSSSYVLKCKRCGRKVLSNIEFENELHKLGLNVGPGGRITASGVFPGYDGFDDSMGKLQAKTAELEGLKAIKCNSCGDIYCVSCLFNYAPPHSNGGKACFNCRGSLREL